MTRRRVHQRVRLRMVMGDNNKTLCGRSVSWGYTRYSPRDVDCIACLSVHPHQRVELRASR